MPYVYSTLATPVIYTITEIQNEGRSLPKEVARIHIKGGAGVATKALTTPNGIVTEVSEEELKQLLNNPVFKLHMEKGYITYDDIKANPNKVSKSMSQDDPSAPLTPESIEKKNIKPPKLNKSEDLKPV